MPRHHFDVVFDPRLQSLPMEPESSNEMNMSIGALQFAGFASALDELRAGRKRGHWIWYVFPQIGGLGSSGLSQRFAIDGEEEAGLVMKQRVDTGHEGLSLGVTTGQVPANDVVRDRKEPTVRTFSAFDARLFAHATDPLVGACGGVARPARFAALESPRVHVVAASEERPEKSDLRLRRRCLIDRP